MRILKNTFYLYLSLLGTMVFGFVQLKVLTSFLTQKEAGLFFAASGISLLLTTTSQLGFPLVYARFIPKYEAENKSWKSRKLLALSVLSYFIVSIPFWILTVLLSLLWKGGNLSRAMLDAYPAYFFYSLLGMLLGFFVGERRMHLTALYNLSCLFLFNLLLFLFRNELEVGLVFRLLLITSLPFLILIFFILKPDFKSVRVVQREIQPFWSFAILGSLLTPLFMYIDRALIPAFLPFSALAIFSVARKVETSVKKMLGVPLSSLAPEVSYYWEKGGEMREGFKSSFMTFVKLYLYMAICTASLLIFLGKPLILLISSKEYISAHKYLAILLAGSTPAALYTPYTMVARSLGRMDLFFIGDLLWVATFMASFFPMVKVLGLTGVALSFAFAHICTSIYVFLYVNPRTVKIPIDITYALAMYAELSLFLLLFYGLNALWGFGALLLTVISGFTLLKEKEKERLKDFIKGS